MPEVLYIRKGTGKKKKEIPMDFCLSLRARGWSYGMIAWKLNQMGYDVSRWTVWRRLRVLERE